MVDNKDFEEFVREQLAYGREKLDKLEISVDNLKERLSILEKAKIYFDGMRAGAVWAIGAGIAAVVTSAVLILDKMKAAGN